jgi:hypothetical protein
MTCGKCYWNNLINLGKNTATLVLDPCAAPRYKIMSKQSNYFIFDT